jgi:hypothetical protein
VQAAPAQKCAAGDDGNNMYVYVFPVFPVLTKKLVVVNSFMPACLHTFVDFLAPDISQQKIRGKSHAFASFAQ